MDPSYITPFITSVRNVFSTMLQLELEVGQPTIKKTTGTLHDVSGIIGMNGDVQGSVVLSLHGETAVRIVALFTGEEMAMDNPDFADAIGELINMICGGAKALFPGNSVSISIPSVVTGKGHIVSQPKDAPCVMLPCTSDCGELAIEIAIKTVQTQTADASSATATA
jgi:chemotaxis protein CheX